MIWFTADTHFSHTNIIRYCNRPFDSIHEMNEVLIDRWNDAVKSNDIIYHLGDFGFYKQFHGLKQIFARLNGSKHLIVGNHDKKPIFDLGWATIHDSYLLRTDICQIWLSHYSHRVWNKSHHGVYHLFGHSHGHLPPYGLSFDVGVDNWCYRPISLDEVVSKMKELKPINLNIPEEDE